MPTYEYKCALGHLYKEERSMNEDQREYECPECQRPLIRIYNPSGITFKGKGFYSTGG